MRYQPFKIVILALLGLAVAACSKGDEKPAVVESHTQQAQKKLTGEELFIERCRDCHRVHETGGVVGPDLSNVGAKRDAQYLAQVIREPSKLYPGTVMPPYDTLPAEQIRLLVDYLISLK